MGEFKKGDVIRAKRDINGFFDKGANYRIAKKIGQNFVLTDNDEPELEDAKHHTDLSWLIENFELVTLKIEAGKFYKTRDGRKLGPIVVAQGRGEPWPWKSCYGWNTYYFKEDGFSCPGSIHNHRDADDLIAEWIDEPVAKPSNDNAKPKFKVGDIVKRSNGFMPHQRLRITKVEGERYSVEWLVGGPGSIDTWRGYEFELVTPAPTVISIVALIENGQPKPSSTPHVHASTGAAEKEAKRLAAKYKGQQFGVFTLTTTHEEAVPVYDHKWQNMAYLGLKIDAIKEFRAVAGLTLKGAKDAVEAWIEYENAA